MIKTLLVILAVGTAPAFAQGPNAFSDSATAFTGVTVLPMDRDSALQNQTVVVRDGRIVAVGPARGTPVPAGARRVDGRGKFMIPGLVDAHAHMMGGNGDPTDGAGRHFALLLANGVTTVRGLIAPPAYPATRERARRGEVLAPWIYLAGPSINGNSVNSTDDARRLVETAKAAGYDWLKTHGGLTREEYDTVVATARRVGIPLSGHVSSGYGLARALEAGQQVEHMDGSIPMVLRDGVAGNDEQIVTDLAILSQVDEAKIAAYGVMTRRAGIASGVTLNLFEIVARSNADSMAALPEMRYVTPQAIAQWRNQVAQAGAGVTAVGAEAFIDLRRRLAYALYRADATIIVSSDSPQFFMVPGFAVHGEMRALAAAGIPTMAVLRAATRSAAETFGADTEFGTVTAGKRADLVLLDADPRADIANTQRIAGVMVRGRWLDAAALRALLDQAARQARPS